ncbi:MAG: Crp/Fnr family transcriptional regulator [Cyclobacteriaceae bacterium]|jgi:CRP-like cAMP-binding protein|nr:Crp/Fnr family transcriptional regulator [Cyclobacteriaceae bacterium]
MIREAALWYFESVNLYNTLCPHKVKKIPETHFIHFKKDAFIYLPLEPSKNIYLIAEGRVKIGHYQEDGKEVVTSILTKGEIFGELAIAGEDYRRDFAQAMDQPTVVCPVSVQDLKDLMKDDRELSFRVLKLMGLRLMKLERKLELLVFKDARTRVIEFLKDAASWKGKKVGFETMIQTKLTHKDIAALTGTSRQTVTTILNELKEANIITFDRRRILIRDLDQLK